MRFFTANPKFKGFIPVTHEDYKALCLAILDDVKRQSLKKFFSKYDTERFANLAIFPEDQAIYFHMVGTVDSLKQQIEETKSQFMLNCLVARMIDETAPGLSPDTPYTFMSILCGKLKKYYPENHDDLCGIKVKFVK